MQMKFTGLLFLLLLPSILFAQIKVAANDATQAEKNEADFQCNGNADQNEINQAFKQGKTVQLSSGTFRCNGTIAGGNNILQGKGKDATTIISTTGTAITLKGSRKTGRGDQGRFNVSGNIAAGATTFTVNGNPELAVGEKFLIFSQDLYCGLRGYYKNGEGAVVKSISGGTITVESPIKLDYKSTPRIATYNFVDNVGMQDFTLRVSNNSIAMSMEFATNVFYKNINLIDPTEGCWQGFRIMNVYGFEYTDLYAEGILHGRSTSNPHGYGFYISGAEDGLIKNCKGYNNKHSFEISGYNEVPVSRNIRIENCETDTDWRSGFSTHGAASDIDWINCTVKNGNGGFLIRSDNNRIINPVVSCTGTNAPFFIGEYTQQGGTWDKFDGIGGDDLYIENPIVDGGGSCNRYFEFRDPIRNVEIVGGTFTGPNNGLLVFYGMECSNFSIKNTTFNVGGLSKLFEMAPGSGSPTIHISFENVKLCDGANNLNLLTTPTETDLTVKGVYWDCN
ncbi:hypothetical protein [Persicobacter diffluens]|uniref:Right handed beta helix domain-containing protein n=1 Tax=Persicobacter diffluens TaxID=981 RepID=A0AAN5AKM8_9BACT|nr:hypothetical protein PEDI_05950 [Persicobacter diffluens]